MNAVAQQDQGAVSTRAKNFVSPEVNIFESKDKYLLEAEMPGVNKDGLEITLEGNELTIVGHRADEAPSAEVIYRESRLADYRRTFELDPAIDTGRIEAQVNQGVLTLTLPKLEKVKPRKIAIAD
ncbi:MAG: Hsp20/alpha crystallin family protein [Verrucomicrobia bacterium]|nr:Hsp20/alpha crystallin family protein [Verrucomicrobiota bacterium]